MKCIIKLESVLLCAFCLSLFSCESDDKKSGTQHDPNKPVVLTDYSPKVGGMATKVIVSGSNFGTDPSKIKVYFNKKEAAVIGCDGENAYVITPKQPGDTCKISVVVEKDSVVYPTNFIYHTTVTVTTVVGKKGTKAFKSGTLAEAEFDGPFYLYVDNNDNIFLSHWKYQEGPTSFVLINQKENYVTELVQTTSLNIPYATKSGVIMAPLDAGYNYYEFDPDLEWAPRLRTILRPNAEQQAAGMKDFTINYKHSFVTNENDGMVYTRAHNGQIIKIDPTTRVGTLVATNIMPNTDGFIIFHPINKNVLYIAYRSYHCIYTYDLDTGKHELYAGSPSTSGTRDGYRLDAEFNSPRQITFTDDGTLYIADYGNHCIRSISPDGMVSTVVGIPGKQGYQDGNPDDALFRYPAGVAVDKNNDIYVADYYNNCIRKLAIE